MLKFMIRNDKNEHLPEEIRDFPYSKVNMFLKTPFLPDTNPSSSYKCCDIKKRDA